ncbi:MAG: ribose 5-phosphate isomerase B [Clostridia bacterium]|nr:ribose 5-phosphate isomerase B [Clostridia bacterium]
MTDEIKTDSAAESGEAKKRERPTGKIAVACDHGGYKLKQDIIRHLKRRGDEFEDYGTFDEESCDYPDIAEQACLAVINGECTRAILICGTGIGISIAANKMPGIRAACCSDTFSARYTRYHNDANALCFGGRVVGPGLAIDMVDLFLDTRFEGGRHQKRVDKITALEKKYK